MKTSLSKTPVYNIKSVAEQSGILPVTLRAWERRYKFPQPSRTGTGYRLYSDYDLATLAWLKNRTDSGMAIAQAVRLFRSLTERGEDPVLKGLPGGERSGAGFLSIEQAQPALVRSLVDLDEEAARRVMDAAFSVHTIEQVLLEIIQPSLVEIGDRWHTGEISVATEHFATHFCRLYLIQAYELNGVPARKGSIVAACAPGELHEMGLLSLAVLLRANGWNVIYLGASISLDRFAETVQKVRPQMLLFSAAAEASAIALVQLADVLAEMPEPKPIIGLGGRAFLEKPSLANLIPGTILGPDAGEAVRQIERMLAHTRA